MDYTTWQAMSGNGVLIGGVTNTTLPPPLRTRQGRTRAKLVFCGAVLGAPLRTTCVQLAATSSIRRIPSSTAVFVVCQDFRTAGPFTPVRATHGLYHFTTCWYRLAISASEVIRQPRCQTERQHRDYGACLPAVVLLFNQE